MFIELSNDDGLVIVNTNFISRIQATYDGTGNENGSELLVNDTGVCVDQLLSEITELLNPLTINKKGAA